MAFTKSLCVPVLLRSRTRRRKKSNCDVRNLEYESLKQKSGFRFKIVNFMFSYDFVFTILLSSQLKINNENANQISYDILHV